MVVEPVDDNEIVTREEVIPVRQVEGIPVVAQGVCVPLERIVSFDDIDICLVRGYDPPAPVPGDNRIPERFLGRQEVEFMGIVM
jgi:hypothetical protein